MTAHPKEMQHISECSVGEVRLLTKLLQILPDVDPLDYFSRTCKNIDALPNRLKRPNAFVRAFKPYSKPRAPLCVLHRHLHPKIANSVFSLIALEVGVHLNRLASNGHLLTEVQTNLIRRLRQMHVLWLDVIKYEKTFQESVSEQQKWKFQTDECEGCMVARIASDPETVLDLRCALLSRMSRRQIKHHGEPRLKIWLDHWLENFKLSFPSKVFEDALERNKQDALDLKDARKQISKERHGRKHRSKAAAASDAPTTGNSNHVDSNPRSTTSKHEQVEDEDANEQAIDADYDAYLDVIDHYKELQSTIGLSTLKKALPDSPHPTAAHADNHPYIHRGAHDLKASATSVYSLDTIRNNDRAITETHPSIPPYVSEESAEEGECIPPRANWNRTQSSVLLPFDLPRPRASQSSEKQAKSYQNLLSPFSNTKKPYQINRSVASVWDDYPLSQSTLATNIDWNRSRGIAEHIFNSPHKNKSPRGEEWTPLPDVFKEELQEADSTRSSAALTNGNHYADRSSSVRYSKPTLKSKPSGSGGARAATGVRSGSGSSASKSSPRSSSISKSRSRAASSATSLSSSHSLFRDREALPTLKPLKYDPNPPTVHPEKYDPNPPTLKPLKYVPLPGQSRKSSSTAGKMSKARPDSSPARYESRGSNEVRNVSVKAEDFMSNATVATDATRWSHVWRIEPEEKGKGKAKDKVRERDGKR